MCINDAECLQRVLKDIVAEKLPALSSHFTTHQCDPSMFTFNWFLVLFVDSLPVNTFLRIWDSFLYEGSKVVISAFNVNNSSNKLSAGGRHNMPGILIPQVMINL